MSALKNLNLSYKKTVNFPGNDFGGILNKESFLSKLIPDSVVFEKMNVKFLSLDSLINES